MGVLAAKNKDIDDVIDEMKNDITNHMALMHK